MKSSLLTIIIAVLVFVFVTHAQDSAVQTPVCLRPFAEKYNEFTYTNAEELKGRLIDFKAAFEKESSDANAIIYVYGGKKTRINEISSLIDNIQKSLKINPNDYRSKISVSDAGYRSLSTVEFFIVPLTCSKWPVATPDFRADQVEFSEFPSTSTISLQMSEIYNRLAEQPEAKCPPAARAVRACIEGTEVEVFIMVDSKGIVQVSQSVTGHPLVRKAAAMWAKKWKFRPLVNGGVPQNFSGTILLQFHADNETIDY